MPISTIESLAAGTPVIASNTGGLADIIKDGQNGWIFEAGNHHDLSSKMKTVINTKDLSEIKNNAVLSAQPHCIQKVADKYLDLIFSLIAQKK